MHLLFLDLAIEMEGPVNALITLDLSKVCSSLVQKS